MSELTPGTWERLPVKRMHTKTRPVSQIGSLQPCDCEPEHQGMWKLLPYTEADVDLILAAPKLLEAAQLLQERVLEVIGDRKLPHWAVEWLTEATDKNAAAIAAASRQQAEQEVGS